MPPSSNPERMALDFAEKFLGRKIPSTEWKAGRNLFKKDGIGKDCIGCFKVDLGNRQSIVYRSGTSDNSSFKTLSGTATLEIKTNDILKINSEKSLKLKFPKLSEDK